MSKLNRRDFLKVSAAAGASAVLASCGGAATEAPAAMPDLTTGEAIPMDALIAAAKTEGQLTTIALPHDWANYGEILSTFKTKYGLTINELNPDAGSADEIEAIRANKDSKGPQAPDVVDVGLAYGPTAKDEGLFAKYKVSTWDTIPLKDADGYWWAEYYGILTFEVIKDAVPTPADWADLLKPEYKGKVAMAGDVLKSNEAVMTVMAAGISRVGGVDGTVESANTAAEAGLRVLEGNERSRQLPAGDRRPGQDRCWRDPRDGGVEVSVAGQSRCPGGQSGPRDRRPEDRCDRRPVRWRHQRLRAASVCRPPVVGACDER